MGDKQLQSCHRVERSFVKLDFGEKMINRTITLCLTFLNCPFCEKLLQKILWSSIQSVEINIKRMKLSATGQRDVAFEAKDESSFFLSSIGVIVKWIKLFFNRKGTYFDILRVKYP